jgi:hypothetical protein
LKFFLHMVMLILIFGQTPIMAEPKKEESAVRLPNEQFEAADQLQRQKNPHPKEEGDLSAYDSRVHF